jgi:hypothetical protein
MTQPTRSNPATTRRLGGTESVRSNAGSRKPTHRSTLTGSVKGKWPWRSPAQRLPRGFNTALYAAFTSRADIRERVNRVRDVLELFDQSDDVLPMKIRRFIKRFGRVGGGR